MTIQITYATVTASAADIRSSATEIGGQLDQLNAKVKKVVATWNGEAQQAYHAQHSGWDAEVNGLKTTLMQIATALEQATEGYQQTDRRAAQQFGS